MSLVSVVLNVLALALAIHRVVLEHTHTYVIGSTARYDAASIGCTHSSVSYIQFVTNSSLLELRFSWAYVCVYVFVCE